MPNALDLGLLSKDINLGSIDTNSLFSCVGAAITCVNENEDNNNVITNNRNTFHHLQGNQMDLQFLKRLNVKSHQRMEMFVLLL